jgi:hypothetical protein
LVPIVEPFATTDTPGIGVPSFESVTLPVITLFCAIAGTTKKQKKERQHTLSKFFSCISLVLVSIGYLKFNMLMVN